jgi:hypothetical protein
MGIYVIDEPGCLEPSSARVYAVEKHGYTAFTVVRNWPPYEVDPSPTPTLPEWGDILSPLAAPATHLTGDWHLH